MLGRADFRLHTGGKHVAGRTVICGRSAAVAVVIGDFRPGVVLQQDVLAIGKGHVVGVFQAVGPGVGLSADIEVFGISASHAVGPARRRRIAAGHLHIDVFEGDVFNLVILIQADEDVFVYILVIAVGWHPGVGKADILESHVADIAYPPAGIGHRLPTTVADG